MPTTSVTDLGVLVAFSGEVDGLTETRANGFGESQTAQRFDTDEWQIMVVAEKFQTGFDQPKLAAMYVDKDTHRIGRCSDPLKAQPDPPFQDRHVRR